MDYKTATIEELEERRSAIGAEIENPEADLNALEEEARSIKAELETRKADAEAKAEIRRQIANDEIKSTKITEKVEKTMDINEIRSSKAYESAYVKAIKTGDDKECRAMLTDLATGGQVPTPTSVDYAISHAWNESDRIIQLCKHTAFKGVCKFSAELTNTGASVHPEGTTRPDEEQITLSVITISPISLKKWISISDELMAMDDGNFINYIFEEVAYYIAKLAVEKVLDCVKSAPTTADATHCRVKQIVDGTCDATIIVKALGELTAEATNKVIVMNPATVAKLECDKMNLGYAYDIFKGLEIVTTDLLPSFDTATSGECYAMVGDFSAIVINEPEGNGLDIKFDELSMAEYDLVKVIGRKYAGFGLVKNDRICRIVNN